MSGSLAGPSLAARLRTSLGLTKSTGYEKVHKEKEEDLYEDNMTMSQNTALDCEMSVLDSGRINLLAVIAKQRNASAAIKSGSEERAPYDAENSAFNLARRLGEGGAQLTVARASLLAEKLRSSPEDCAELLRRNVFWPMLTACVECVDSSDKDGMRSTLNVLCLVLSDPAAKAVVTAQLLCKDKELVVTGLAMLFPWTLRLAWQLTEATRNRIYLSSVVCRVARESLFLSDAGDLHLLFVSVVKLTVDMKESTEKKELVELRRYATKLALQHKMGVDLLALCKG
jgi:hypothetical protein